ncbi:MAG: hypothetical protein AB7V26_13180 [Lysobacterales bacterium]
MLFLSRYPVLASLLLCGAVFAAQDNQLVIQDQNSSKALGRVFSLDYVSDGSAVGLQIRVKADGLNKRGLDLSKCLADLPKSHVGTCKLTDAGEILVLVYSGSNAALPAGLVSIGTVAMQGKAQGPLVVSELLVADKNANPIRATSIVE